MGSGSARVAARLFVVVATAAAFFLMLARGGESASFCLPPPCVGGGGEGFLGGADRYLTRDERWMDQTVDHFNPTLAGREHQASQATQDGRIPISKMHKMEIGLATRCMPLTLKDA